tara:strand:+ start:111 stop:506 length:396 start_codon:yes stop_codon:yes gene_type:complete
MAKMIHSMLRVFDAKKSIEFYQTVFDFRVKRQINFDDFDLIYLGNDETDFELELTANHGQKEVYELGNGYGHLALAAENIEDLHARAEAAGYSPKDVKSFYNGDDLVAKFFFVKDPDGYDIEVIERSEFYK